MKKSRFTEGRIMAILRQVERGTAVLELCRQPQPVTEAIRKANPQAEIVIAADDDHKLEAHPVIRKNVGRDKAEGTPRGRRKSRLH